jgi:hypothetical protein
MTRLHTPHRLGYSQEMALCRPLPQSPAVWPPASSLPIVLGAGRGRGLPHTPQALGLTGGSPYSRGLALCSGRVRVGQRRETAAASDPEEKNWTEHSGSTR